VVPAVGEYTSSGAAPHLERRLASLRASVGEEISQDLTALILTNATDYLGTVIETTIAQNVKQ
jgi:hypothetical protein